MSETDESSVGCAHSGCERDVDGEEHCYWHREEKGKEPGSDDSPVTEISDYLSGAYLRGATLTGESFSATNLNSVKFQRADLIDANLRDANLRDANLRDANLRDANLRDANLRDANLRNANLTDADLTETEFPDADLPDADIRGANLLSADLPDADLRGAKLPEATLQHADLPDADLTDADLRYADLTDTYLRDADLTDADLRYADLTDADLRGADLTGANLRNATTENTVLNNHTEVGSRLPQWFSNMTDHARTYHDLRTIASDEGYDELARDLYVLEQKARTRAAFPQNPLTFLGGSLSGLLTGYGVRPRQVLISTATVVFLTTLWFSQVGVGFEDWNTVYEFSGVQFRTGSLYYSVVTFVTAPPHPPQSTDLLTNVLVTLETYLGTVLTLLLGYALSNRSRV